VRCSPQQLDAALKRALAPVYLVFGDEPLQLGEAAAAIRARASAQGFAERTCLEAGPQFDWSALSAEAGNRSLFADRRLIELRVAGEGVGRQGGDALRAYCERGADDVLLLIIAPGLDWKSLKSKWAQVLDGAGVIVQVRQLQGGALQQWLGARLQAQGFRPTREALALLAERVEGNLLAADQEITKLALVREPGPLDAEALSAAVHDSARYDLFDLTDAAMAGDRARVTRIVRGLAAEGTAEPLVLWVLAREIRKLAAVAFAVRHNKPLGPVLKAHQVWESRRTAVLAAAKRIPLERLWSLVAQCAEADTVIKGHGQGDAWTLLAGIADGLVVPLQHGRPV
jgi:DNA polymerase-3 subunit delta